MEYYETFAVNPSVKNLSETGEFFVISKSNYRNVYLKKLAEEYMQFFMSTYKEL